MCVPSPIDLVLIDKKSAISFRLKFGKQLEEGSISNYPLPESNYFSREPMFRVYTNVMLDDNAMLRSCKAG